MTKREKIIKYLVDNGMQEDVIRYHIDKRWDKPGTIVLKYLPLDYWRKLYFDLYMDNPDRKIDIHRIRVHFEWQDECYRISWIGD